MKLIKTKEKTVRYKTEVYNLYTDINLVVEYTNNKIVSQSIPSSFKNCTFLYVKDRESFLKVFKENYIYNIHRIDDNLSSYKIKDLKSHFESNKFVKSNLFAISLYDHTLRTYQNKPIPILRNVDYINGFKQREENSSEDYYGYGYFWDWDKLRTFLSSHKKVLNFKEVPIPHYNQSFYGQMSFDFDILYPESINIDGLEKVIKFLGIDVKKMCKK